MYRQILIGDVRQRNRRDIQFCVLDQVEKQIERSLIDRCVKGVIDLTSQQAFHRQEIIPDLRLKGLWGLNISYNKFCLKNLLISMNRVMPAW